MFLPLGSPCGCYGVEVEVPLGIRVGYCVYVGIGVRVGVAVGVGVSVGK